MSSGAACIADRPLMCEPNPMVSHKSWRARLRKHIEDRGLDMKKVSIGAGLNAAAVQQIVKGK